jgi:branched-chain amino acid transport system ATP-binding protein
MQDAVLKLTNVNTYYGQIHALRDINFEVRKGEIVTLIGSNGAGKSTTLRTISSQLVPATGEVVYEGRTISKLPAHEVVAQGIAHVPEGRKIFPVLTVEENLQMGAFLSRSEKERATSSACTNVPALKSAEAAAAHAFGRQQRCWHRRAR